MGLCRNRALPITAGTNCVLDHAQHPGWQGHRSGEVQAAQRLGQMDQRPQEPGPGVPCPWPTPCPRVWVPQSAVCPPGAPPSAPGHQQTPARILTAAAALLPEVNQDLPGTVIMSHRHNPPLQPGQGGIYLPWELDPDSCPQGWTEVGHGSSSPWGGQHPPPKPIPTTPQLLSCAGGQQGGISQCPPPTARSEGWGHWSCSEAMLNLHL